MHLLEVGFVSQDTYWWVHGNDKDQKWNNDNRQIYDDDLYKYMYTQEKKLVRTVNFMRRKFAVVIVTDVSFYLLIH